MKRRLISSIILLIPLMYVAMGGMLGLPMPGFLTGMENALISALTQLVITVPVILINRKFYIVGFKGARPPRAEHGFSGWRSAPAPRCSMASSPCTAWPTALATATWPWYTNTPTPSTLSPRR